MNFRQKLICTTYEAPIAFIVCLVMSLFLISIGCDGQQQQPKPTPAQRQSEPEPVRTTEDDLAKIEEDYQKKLDEIEKKRLIGYMTASESERWLINNHYQVQKKADGDGYIITRNYYDPSTQHRDESRYVIGGRGTVGLENVTMTIDDKGHLRVKVSGTQ